MDIINRLHSTFKDCKYFEFGEDFVRFKDENGTTYKVTVEEESKHVEKSILKGVESIQKKKSIKPTRKTWESIINDKNK